MMSWRALSPKTIVAAAEAVARRKAEGRGGAAHAAGAGAASGNRSGGSPAAAPRHPVDDVGALRPPRAAE